MTSRECPLKRCAGRLDPAAFGTDANGRTVEWSICDRCGKTVETQVAIDHPELDFTGGGA